MPKKDRSSQERRAAARLNVLVHSPPSSLSPEEVLVVATQHESFSGIFEDLKMSSLSSTILFEKIRRCKFSGFDLCDVIMTAKDLVDLFKDRALNFCDPQSFKTSREEREISRKFVKAWADFCLTCQQAVEDSTSPDFVNLLGCSHDASSIGTAGHFLSVVLRELRPETSAPSPCFSLFVTLPGGTAEQESEAAQLIFDRMSEAARTLSKHLPQEEAARMISVPDNRKQISGLLSVRRARILAPHRLVATHSETVN
jgi:hypothetical protein